MNAPYASMSVEAAERAYNAAHREFTEAELKEARDELRDEIIAGKTRGGFNLEACFDCEFNSPGYTDTVNDIAALVLGLYSEGSAATWLGVLALAERIVEKHLPESAIEDRAARIRADRAEEA